ncbi:Auxin-induced protein 5NG4 [Hordeum vulgare]|nr:Auxin-induced protein 5NG4 [Hordeum vulgare]
MQYNDPTFELPPTVSERRYPAGVVVERTLRVWAFSCWRGARGTPPIGLTVTFTNSFDAYYLLGKVFWCGCEFIALTTHNIFTKFDYIFPTRDGMHNLPYYIVQDDMEREQ